jgi:hypothetical protein
MTAAKYRQLVLIREFDERRFWALHGATSCAAWLHWRIGLGTKIAYERLRVAHALSELPVVSEAFSKGEVSYSQVRAITRIADGSTEETWLYRAQHCTGAQLERIVRDARKVEAAQDPDYDKRHRQQRELTTYTDDDGMMVIRCRLPPDAGAQVMAAIDAAKDGVPCEDSSFAQKRADALVALAELSHSGQAETERASGAERQRVIVHCDEHALLDPTAPGRREVEGGGCVSGEVARRLSCDAEFIRIVHGPNGEPLDVGRKTRTLTTAIRRALQSRDGGCLFPGCTHKIVDGHHIEHWVDGGETKLSNLASLCRVHHGYVHEGGFSVERVADGDSSEEEFVFRDPQGRVVQTGSGLMDFEGSVESLSAMNRAVGLDLDAETFVCEWDGEPPDYEYIAACVPERAPVS